MDLFNVLVRDANGWIVSDEKIYGSNGMKEYFFIDIRAQNVQEFRTLIELDEYLKRKGTAEYDMNKERNISHLRYGHEWIE